MSPPPVWLQAFHLPCPCSPALHRRNARRRATPPRVSQSPNDAPHPVLKDHPLLALGERLGVRAVTACSLLPTAPISVLPSTNSCTCPSMFSSHSGYQSCFWTLRGFASLSC